MAIRVYKPMTPGTRQRSVLTSEEITKKAPEKSLVVTKKKTIVTYKIFLLFQSPQNPLGTEFRGGFVL